MTINPNLAVISHENIYRMMMYVYRDLYDETLETQDDFFEHLDDMMTDILMMGIIRQFKRGLYKEYVRKQEPSMMIRGKIDIHESIKLRTQQSQQLVCAYDAFDQDNLYNQILKSTCLYVLRQGRISKARRKKLKDLLLSFHQISEVPLRAVTWENIRFHKDKIAYRSLIGVCYMIYKGLIEDETTRQTYLQAIVVADLYERFIQHFYKKEWPEIQQGYQGKYNSSNEGVSHVRNMLTVDMLLTYEQYRLIVNTHYFENLFNETLDDVQKDFLEAQMQRLFGTIGRNAFNKQGVVEGFLLYPSLERSDIRCYEAAGRRVYLGNVDLSGPFEEIKGILMDIGEDVVTRGEQ